MCVVCFIFLWLINVNSVFLICLLRKLLIVFLSNVLIGLSVILLIVVKIFWIVRLILKLSVLLIKLFDLLLIMVCVVFGDLLDSLNLLILLVWVLNCICLCFIVGWIVIINFGIDGFVIGVECGLNIWLRLVYCSIWLCEYVLFCIKGIILFFGNGCFGYYIL